VESSAVVAGPVVVDPVVVDPGVVDPGVVDPGVVDPGVAGPVVANPSASWPFAGAFSIASLAETTVAARQTMNVESNLYVTATGPSEFSELKAVGQTFLAVSPASSAN
jgi:hypothetical protein